MKHIIGPMELAKGVSPGGLAAVMRADEVPHASNIKMIVGPGHNPLGIELDAGILDHVHVELLTENDVILLRCRKCGTAWVPALEDGKRLSSDWWICPRDKGHSHLSG